MDIESDFKLGDIPNSLKNLDEENILQILQLSCASNDLVTNSSSLSKFPEGENAYFFYNSICIVREIAKLIDRMSGSKLASLFSSNTSEEFKKLEKSLKPFDEDSLSKSVLKPIRDANVHYEFPTSKEDNKVLNLLNQLKSASTLEVGVKPDDCNLMSVRYTFADWFRNEYFNSHLNSGIVNEISVVSVGIVAFVDSLLADLVNYKHD
jgi:hypothetical protein